MGVVEGVNRRDEAFRKHEGKGGQESLRVAEANSIGILQRLDFWFRVYRVVGNWSRGDDDVSEEDTGKLNPVPGNIGFHNCNTVLSVL